MHLDFPTHICKLQKSIYCLKQALWAWFAKLSDRLLSFGFQPSLSDSSLFILRQYHVSMFVLVYVDDIVVTVSNSSAISDFIAFIKSFFPIKGLNPLHYFLGIELHCTNSSLFLSQTKYITDLLVGTNMHASKSVSTPMAVSDSLNAFDGNSINDPSYFHSIVGSLQYLSLTRPNISYTVNRVCQYMHHSRTPHW